MQKVKRQRSCTQFDECRKRSRKSHVVLPQRPRMSLLSISPELRLELYDAIIHSTYPLAPTSHALRGYQGLFLSSKQIHAEFQAHWQQFFQRKTLEQIKRAWSLDAKLPITTPTHLGESNNLRILVPKIFTSNATDRIWNNLKHFFTLIVDQLHCCTLIPDPSVWKTREERAKCLFILQDVLWQFLTDRELKSHAGKRKWAWTPLCVYVAPPSKDGGGGTTKKGSRVCRIMLGWDSVEQCFWRHLGQLPDSETES